METGMGKLTPEEILTIMCAPEAIDEPEESDFEKGDAASEDLFIRSQIAKELN